MQVEALPCDDAERCLHRWSGNVRQHLANEQPRSRVGDQLGEQAAADQRLGSSERKVE